ncbi:hypothetical protein XENOCAPTIV_010894 [Xenoophorus captivus]|uniref:Uncharacterized protein n=1 Tax=Xenoophorus captivus TaxID=1517983 RepID=A0ABV0S6K5_9TELE
MVDAFTLFREHKLNKWFYEPQAELRPTFCWFLLRRQSSSFVPGVSFAFIIINIVPKVQRRNPFGLTGDKVFGADSHGGRDAVEGDVSAPHGSHPSGPPPPRQLRYEGAFLLPPRRKTVEAQAVQEHPALVVVGTAVTVRHAAFSSTHVWRGRKQLRIPQRPQRYNLGADTSTEIRGWSAVPKTH